MSDIKAITQEWASRYDSIFTSNHKLEILVVLLSSLNLSNFDKSSIDDELVNSIYGFMGKKFKSKKQTELYLSILKKELLHLSSILPEDTGSVVVDNVVYTPPKKDVDFLKKLGI